MNLYMIMILLALFGGILGAGIILLILKVSFKHVLCLSFLNLMLIFYFALVSSAVMNGLGTFGLNSSGGAVGLLIGIVIYSKVFPRFSERIIKAYALMIPYMYGVGKIGCATSGCCAGRLYSGPLCIHVGRGNVFPVQFCQLNCIQ